MTGLQRSRLRYKLQGLKFLLCAGPWNHGDWPRPSAERLAITFRQTSSQLLNGF